MPFDGPSGPQLELLSEIRYEIERLNDQFTEARLGIQVQPEFSLPAIEVLPAPVILPPAPDAVPLDLTPLLAAVGTMRTQYEGSQVGLIAMLEELKKFRKDMLDLVQAQRAAENHRGLYGMAGAVTVTNDTTKPAIVASPQSIDSFNTFTITGPAAASTVTGGWTPTRALGIVRELTVVASDVASGLGGTFEFQFSEDGSTPTIDETRPITSFATVRDFDLENYGAYYRVKFTPSRPLVTGEHVFVTTQLARAYDGPFVRLASQQMEKQNAAFSQTFAYLQGFDVNGLSENFSALLATDQVNATEYGLLTKSIGVGQAPDGSFPNERLGGLLANSPAPSALAGNAVYTSNAYDLAGYVSIRMLIDSDAVSAASGVDVQFSDTAAFTNIRGHQIFTFTTRDVSNGFRYEQFAPQARYMRIVYTNGASAQTNFFIQFQIDPEKVENPNPLVAVPIKGVYGGQSGTANTTVNVPAGAVVNSYAGQSGSSAGTITVPGITGNITVPGSNQASTQFQDNPSPGSLVGPCSVTFTNLASWTITWVL